MTVSESDNITSTISYLRQNVYSLPQFRAELISNLSLFLGANGVAFNHNQYGGLDINVKCKPSNDSGHRDSAFYLNKIIFVIQKAVSATSKDNINITSSMINVTSVGADSIVIRI